MKYLAQSIETELDTLVARSISQSPCYFVLDQETSFVSKFRPSSPALTSFEPVLSTLNLKLELAGKRELSGMLYFDLGQSHEIIKTSNVAKFLETAEVAAVYVYIVAKSELPFDSSENSISTEIGSPTSKLLKVYFRSFRDERDVVFDLDFSNGIYALRD
jgi:hypothetical protein